MSREIIVSAKLGGADPNANFRLRQAIDRAKAEGVPNDNIQRAIEKGSGGGSVDNLEELVYEGYGPGGVAILVRCLTDNRNRTAGDVRSYFSKYGGNLGDTGCVGWNFVERGEIEINKVVDDDKLLQAAIESGAADLDTTNDEIDYVYCEPNLLEAVRNALLKSGYKVVSAQITMSPKSTVEINNADLGKQLLRLLDTLENHDDVQNVYANFDMNQNWMQEFLN
jgi:YebC/PmpR family DNA-binding regulatory protein